MTDKNGKRLYGLDYMKAMAIVFVLILHTGILNIDFIGEPSVGHVVQYFIRLLSEGVPVFLMVNGFLLFRKQEFDLKKHLRKTLHIFIIFLLWAVILTFVGYLSSGTWSEMTAQDFLSYIFNTAVGSQYTGVLWFLQNLIGVYLVYPLIRFLFDKNRKLFHYFFILLAFFSVGVSILKLIRDFAAVYCDTTLFTSALDFINRFSSLGNIWYLFYFCLGGEILCCLPLIRKYKCLLILLGFISWLLAGTFGLAMSHLTGEVYNGAFNYASIFMVMTLIGYFALFGDMRAPRTIIGKSAAGVGKYTMGIYLVHMIVIGVLNSCFPILNVGIYKIMKLLLTLALSYFFAVIVSRIPYLKKIISV